MPNKIIKSDKGVVSIRIDGVYTGSSKHLLIPYIDTKTNKERFFGSFKFLNPKEAKETIKEAIKMLPKVEDTVFGGQYPKWEEHATYGTSLKVNGRVKFFQNLNSVELVPDLEVPNYIYSIEVHLTPTKDNKIYLTVVRAIAIRKSDNKFNNDLYKGEEVKDEDLPF